VQAVRQTRVRLEALYDEAAGFSEPSGFNLTGGSMPPVPNPAVASGLQTAAQMLRDEETDELDSQFGNMTMNANRHVTMPASRGAGHGYQSSFQGPGRRAWGGGNERFSNIVHFSPSIHLSATQSPITSSNAQTVAAASPSDNVPHEISAIPEPSSTARTLRHPRQPSPSRDTLHALDAALNDAGEYIARVRR
jgi:hypothetical protein